MRRDRTLDVLDKAQDAQTPVERDFNLEIIAGAIPAKVENFDLINTADTDNPVGNNNDLADRDCQGGFEAANETGLRYSDASGTIRFAEDELNTVLNG